MNALRKLNAWLGMYDSFFYCILSLKDSKKDVIWKEVYVNSLYKVYIWKETLDLWSHINEIIRETIYVRICTFFWIWLVTNYWWLCHLAWRNEIQHFGKNVLDPGKYSTLGALCQFLPLCYPANRALGEAVRPPPRGFVKLYSRLRSYICVADICECMYI